MYTSTCSIEAEQQRSSNTHNSEEGFLKTLGAYKTNLVVVQF